jgi:hypothetical protein
MSAPSRLAELLDRMPQPDEKLQILSNADKEQTEKALAELEGGGRETLVALVGMLADRSKVGEKVADSQARHAIHALGTRAAGRGGDGRRQFAEALASTLGGADRPAEVKAFVIHQIQLTGGKGIAPALGRLLTDENLFEPAAQALLAIRDGAAEQFRKALPNAKGKQRATVAQALGVLKDVEAAPALRRLAADDDRDTRLVALWALANLPDAESTEVVMKAADAAPGWERQQAAKACLLLADNLFAAGKKPAAVKLYRYLRDSRIDFSERYVREAAVRNLDTAG